MGESNQKIDISVIICVFNGGEPFRKNIESAARLKAPTNRSIEIIVVDSSSTDGTKETIKNYVQKYPGTFRHLNMPNMGLSAAKNLALKEARGDILAFTDADTVLPEDWLLHIREGFKKYECTALGGRVLPAWETKPPAWFMKETKNGTRCGILSLWAGREAGYYPRGKGPSSPTGCNSAVKKEAFSKYGGYRTELGVWPGRRLGGEETDFFYRISRAGEKIFYYPPMTVYHQIPKTRLTKRYLRQNSFMFCLSSLYFQSLYPSQKRCELAKNLLALPEILFKFWLAGFSRTSTTHSNFHYRIRIQNILCELGYRLFGLDHTIKTAKILHLIQ